MTCKLIVLFWIFSESVSLSVWEWSYNITPCLREIKGIIWILGYFDIDVVINFNWLLACLKEYISWRRELMSYLCMDQRPFFMHNFTSKVFLGACLHTVGVVCLMPGKWYCVDFVFTLNLWFKWSVLNVCYLKVHLCVS